MPDIDEALLSEEHVESCDIYTQSSAQNSAGEVVETWTKTVTAQACLIQPISGRQTLIMQGLKIDAQYICFVKADVTSPQNRYKIVSNGKTYFVEHIRKTWSRFNTHVELYLKMEPSNNELSSGY